MTQDTSLNPPQQPDSDDNGVYASLASLSEDGITPGVGDKVSVTVEGTIHSINGDTACITPETVNGEAVPQPNDQEPDADDLRAQMAAQDEASY